MLPRQINERTPMQAAAPAYETSRLFSVLGVGLDVLRYLALAIILLSGISVFISLYNSLKDRQYELALMRVLGASRRRLFSLILLEGLLLALVGYLLGFLLSRGALALLGQLAADAYRYDFSGSFFLPEELNLLLVTLAVGLLAALLPAWQAYRTNISRTLSEG